MNKTITIGDNITFTSDSSRNLTLSFSPDDITNCWSNADRLAGLITDYYHLHSNKECTTIISTVLNELIENAVKYAENKSETVKIDTLKNEDKLLIKISNTLPAERLTPFIDECKKLFHTDLKTLFIKRIESLKKEAPRDSSGGIGLILLKKDYNTGIKFIFYENNDVSYKVSVIAELTLV